MRLGRILTTVLLPGVLLPHSALAQFDLPQAPPGVPDVALPQLIARLIQTVLVLVGVLALGFIVYGGFRYILSRGDEREVEAAKQTITMAVIGIVVIGIGYALVEFVFRAVTGGGAGGIVNP